MAAFDLRPLLLKMEIDEEKIRQIVREARRELGPHADPALLKKIVREVIRTLEREHHAAAACDCHRESR